MRCKPQINLLYMFALGEGVGYPSYYKQYISSTPNVSAFTNIFSEPGTPDCTIVTDKGFASKDGFGLIEESGLSYIIPLKRGNAYVNGRTKGSMTK